MKKASIILLLLTFLLGMGAQYLFSNLSELFSEDDVETVMADEEHSSANLTKDACLQDYYLVDQDIQKIAQAADQEILLSNLVEAIHSDVNTLTIRHDDFTLEYFAIKSMDKDIVVNSSKNFAWVDYKKKNKLYYLQTYLPLLYVMAEPIIYKHFEKNFDSSKVAYIETKARSPGEEIPYGRIHAIK